MRKYINVTSRFARRVMDILSIIQKYDKNNITIAVLGSHSALDVCRGAKDLGFKTLVIIEKGRGKTYKEYYKTRDVILESPESNNHEDPGHGSASLTTGARMTDGQVGMTTLGCIDEVIELEKFAELLNPEIQEELRKRNSIFIPHRSFEVYVNDYDGIENNFEVPIFGNRFLLKSEERGVEDALDQYKILDTAGIRYPKQFKDPKEIDRLSIVKVLEKERGFERAFFLVNSYEAYQKESQKLINQGKITKEALERAVIEEFILGVQVNFNFFYDPISKRLELLGTDTRRQTNIEGFTKVPNLFHSKFLVPEEIKYEEAGHIAVTVLESMLEKAFEIGEKFIAATQKLSSPGVIGPFGLQSMIIPGPPKKDIIVFDVSPRMPGSPGIFATPYSNYLYGENLSAGKRVAMQIRQAIEKDKLEEILT